IPQPRWLDDGLDELERSLEPVDVDRVCCRDPELTPEPIRDTTAEYRDLFVDLDSHEPHECAGIRDFLERDAGVSDPEPAHDLETRTPVAPQAVLESRERRREQDDLGLGDRRIRAGRVGVGSLVLSRSML